MSYIVIPIFSDPFLHPLHKDNGLSLLYIKELDKLEALHEKEEAIISNMQDLVEDEEDFDEEDE